MASIEITTPVLTLGSIFHVGVVVLGFVLYARMDNSPQANRDIKTLALIIAITGIFFPTLSLLNVTLYAVSLKI